MKSKVCTGLLVAMTLLAAGCNRSNDRTAGTDGTGGDAGVPRTTDGGNSIPNSNGIPAAVNGSITTGPGVPPFKGGASTPANAASEPARGTGR